ncbi:MAG: NAD(P)-dependent alcohol dehydrogenase [Clostridiales Family XIII bacterium]|jgi:L-iditol 2-dehydrogenase|nr:NAD(P)-dependent alcohol dehydrogenase [Clostridiales Family XIII bacterium]
MENNKAAYMTGINKLEVRDNVPIPEIGSGEVLVKVEYVGICGSDIHYLVDGRIADFIVEGDFILGHEAGGTIVKVADDVVTHKAGDRVAIEPGLPCGKCEFCRTGRYNLCPKVAPDFMGTPPTHGAFTTYVAWPAEWCFILPDNMSTLEGALVEPLSVGLEATHVAGVKLGSSVTILGSGCIGLCTLLAAKAKGATEIIVVDVIEKRLEKARELGATKIINAKEVDAIEEISKYTDGKGTDFVIETAGNKVTLRQTVDIAKRGGRIVIVGMGADAVIPFNFEKLMWKVLSIGTVFRYQNQYAIAIDAISNGKIDVKQIVTAEYDIDDIQEAFETNIKNKDEVVKLVIKL